MHTGIACEQTKKEEEIIKMPYQIECGCHLLLWHIKQEPKEIKMEKEIKKKY